MTSITQTMKLKPWQTPNFAVVDLPPRLKQEGLTVLPSIPLKELDYETLCELADAWLREVFSKASRPCPFSRIEGMRP